MNSAVSCFDPDRVRHLLKDCSLVRCVTAFDRINSTSTWAKAQIARSPQTSLGLLVTAEAQTAGRGRLSRVWTAAAGKSLLFSLVVRCPAEPAVLTLGVPLAVADALNEAVPHLGAQVKWPNDILVSGRKVCGILLERVGQTVDGASLVVVGIGLNVSQAAGDFPKSLCHSAGSLRMMAPREAVLPTREELLAAVVRKIETTFCRRVGDISVAYNALGHSIGRDVCLLDGRTGVAVGVDKDGALLLRAADGTEFRLLSGEVGYLPGE